MILLFEDNKSFLHYLDDLMIDTYFKYIPDILVLDNQIRYLSNVDILTWNAFDKVNLIELTVLDKDDIKHRIIYKFKDANYYSTMNLFLNSNLSL